MKIGDTVPVTIAGQTVANASVKELADGTATLVVPATLVVMATRTELTVETPRESSTETVITGVDQEGVERTESAVGQDQTSEASETSPTDTTTSTVAGEGNAGTESEASNNASTQTHSSESTTTENSSNEAPAVQDTSASVETSTEVKE